MFQAGYDWNAFSHHSQLMETQSYDYPSLVCGQPR